MHEEYKNVTYITLIIQLGVVDSEALKTGPNIPIIIQIPQAQHKFHPVSLVS